MAGKTTSLVVRFAALLLTTMVVALGVFWLVTSSSQRESSEQKVLEEARLLRRQTESAWDYVDSIQTRINLNADGTYSFKGIYCSVAGKAIAQRFTNTTECTIRYVRENPRSGTDRPDEFELAALRSFALGNDEYWEVRDFDGVSSMRYLSAIRISYGCLSCHGEPAGEPDVTGYMREGMGMGDLAGAVSIVIPMGQYEAEASERTAQYAGLFLALAVAIVASVSVGVYAWVVSPFRRLGAEAERIGRGDFAGGVRDVGGASEVRSLAEGLARMEDSLREFYASLETQVGERTAELREANEELALRRDEIATINERLLEANAALRQENEYKSTFLATMSHELRTPLTSIIAFADVIQRTRGLDSEALGYLEEIKRNSRELLSAVNNVLDAARLEAGRIELHPEAVDLVDLAGSVRATFAPLALEKGLRLTFAVDPDAPLVEVDPDVLRKIVGNLVGNAVKFTEPGGSVGCSVGWDAAAGELSVQVRDTGVGIPASELEAVFERFRQVDASSSRAHGGSGLGLSLVKDLVGLCGGDVRVESSEGVGSTFTVRVPCPEAQEGESE